ncbi:MAG: LysM peptidoglycan-binding domain-containing protein, partial [Planctomycetota bacterium]
PGFPKTHTIQEGDTYYKIAKAEYGSADPRLIAHLQKANPGLEPARLPVGKEISVPAPPADGKPPASRPGGSSSKSAPASQPAPGAAAQGEAKSAPAPSGPAKLPLRYLVQRGDTLGKLARRFYGDPNKFHVIADANEDLKYGGDLIAGTTITIPALR